MDTTSASKAADKPSWARWAQVHLDGFGLMYAFLLLLVLVAVLLALAPSSPATSCRWACDNKMDHYNDQTKECVCK